MDPKRQHVPVPGSRDCGVVAPKLEVPMNAIAWTITTLQIRQLTLVVWVWMEKGPHPLEIVVTPS